jgi:Tfp pilus assembly protein PilX
MMNKQQNPNNRSLVYFLLQTKQIGQQDSRSDQGYAMMLTAIVSILLFSLLTAYMTISNLSKSSTNAYVDGTNTFYAAESGLNGRAEQLRQKFIGYASPTGTSPGATSSAVTAANVSNCFTQSISTTASITTNDFECRNYAFRYGNSSATVKNLGTTDAWGGVTETTNKNETINYTAFTFVADRTNRINPTDPTSAPVAVRIPPGQAYEGLNAQEYRYTVYATAAKVGNSNIVQASDAKTVLQMDFKSRIVPLFQFAAFYEDDLEMDSQMPMSVSGPVHTNGSLRAASYGFNNGLGFPGTNAAPFTDPYLSHATRLMDNVTVAGSVYDRIAATQDGWRPSSSCSSTFVGGIGYVGSGQYANCGIMAVYKGSGGTESISSYDYFPDATAGRTAPLNTTELGVFQGRLLDGSLGVKRLNPPKPGFLREKNYLTNVFGVYYGKADLRIKFFPGRAMKFDFTPIKAGTGCAIAANNIPADRQGSSALSCTALTKGQLWSLQQPVLTTTSTTLSTEQLEILKLLKIAIATTDGGTVGTPKPPLTLVQLGQSVDFDTISTNWGKTFKDLVIASTIISGATKGSLTTGMRSANDIATAQDTTAAFLPPPIQIVSGNSTSTDLNTNDAGFFNRLKGTWMTMLQTNIRSLTFWNDDGISVEPIDLSLTTTYTTPTTITTSSGISTANKAFIRSAADTSAVVGSFPKLGLAAADRTEGGLVLHATVSDDTDGVTGDEITNSSSDKVTGKDSSGNLIPHVDNYRRYPSSAGIRQSPYAFVFSGGQELPGPLTIATDQAAYIQGDYNNPGVTPNSLPQTTAYRPSNAAIVDQGFRRRPAAIIADTITVLSNQCVNNNGRVGRVEVTAIPAISVQCGNSTVSIGSSDQNRVSNGIAINAAFLSNLMQSGSGQATYNGGLNKFMRLLENWGGSTGGTFYNYSGSMVSLGQPLESGELPSGAGVPQRNFNYETRFDSFDNLPPLTPSAIYLQQEVFKRTYN